MIVKKNKMKAEKRKMVVNTLYKDNLFGIRFEIKKNKKKYNAYIYYDSRLILFSENFSIKEEAQAFIVENLIILNRLIFSVATKTKKNNLLNDLDDGAKTYFKGVDTEFSNPE